MKKPNQIVVAVKNIKQDKTAKRKPDKLIEALIPYENSFDASVLTEEGFSADNGRILISEGNSYHGAFIPAISLGSDGSKAYTFIVKTLNDGFVHVGADADGNIVKAASVDNPCIIGNFNKPYGIYIPMNSKAVDTGLKFINNNLEKGRKELL